MTVNSRENMKRWAIGIMTGAALLAVAVPAYADTAAASAGGQRRDAMVEKLVEEGTISQSTCDAIQSYMEANRPEALGQGEENADNRPSKDGFLTDAVTDGIISQETADQLKAYMESKMEERKAADGSETGNMGRGGNRTEMWDNMLSAGVITQDEYNAIIAAMPQRGLDAQPES